MKGLDELMKQAQRMQSHLEDAQRELQDKEFVGQALAGEVVVRGNGRYQILDIEMSPAVYAAGREAVAEAVKAGFNDLVQKVEIFSKQKMGGLMQGIELPGDFKNPLSGD
jgi:DNA-binding YbaB/EbfC family protein